MTRLTNRFTSRTNSFELPDTAELRERIMDAVEQAIDRVEGAVADSPTPAEAAARLRRTRAVEMIGTAAVAAGPTVARYAKSRAGRAQARKVAPALVLTPLRAHPVVFGASLVAAAAGGVMWARRRARRDQDSQLRSDHDSYVRDADSSSFGLSDEVARMEDEGGGPVAVGSIDSSSKRFVRSNGSSAATR